jgi:hypothetical protein
MAFKFSDAEPCECGWLERADADPAAPITFDSKLNEYNLSYIGPGGPTKMLLRYCSFCGGAAPKSRRADMFMELTSSELARLDQMTRGLETLEFVVATLGQPDDDLRHGDGRDGREEHGAPTFERCRTLVYRRLSETAEMRVSERADGTVRFSYSGKRRTV